MTGDRLTLQRIAAAFTFAALAACGTTSSPEPDHSVERAAVAAYFGADFSCTREQAQLVDLKTLRRNPNSYSDKCVRVTAYADDRRLRIDARDEPKSNEEAFAQIGAYWKDDSIRKRISSAPTFVTVVGRVRDCMQRYKFTQEKLDMNATPGGTPPAPAMLGGACHYFATAILVSEVQIIPTAMD